MRVFQRMKVYHFKLTHDRSRNHLITVQEEQNCLHSLHRMGIQRQETASRAELFNVLREKIDINNLNSLVKEKVFPVAGDISFEDFGIENSEMKDEMLKEIDIVRHSAATTRFDERYHIAMNINVLGAANVLKFAKRCANVKILVHVSTDIDVERKVIEDKLKDLEAQNLSSKEVTMAMRDLGIQR
ncbi:putative fatty acyl-CoA reductase 3-like [Capsicum annuum]|nr:putative fatty acyl-CoA reductase 3-like [Capsicum annuum]